MSILFTKAYITDDGKTHSTIDEAKRHEVEQLFLKAKCASDVADLATKHVIANAQALVDILTLKATSHPKGRKANGASRKRIPKAPEAPPVDKEAPPF